MDDAIENNTDSASLSGLKSDIRQLKADLAQLMETLKITARDATVGAASDAAALPIDTMDEISLCIQEQPIKSVAIAAGIGAFLGVLLFR
ncbi:hypothetical protein GCM10007301_56980 [Azorhizobium oxalatiphilum]|uniref:DUF883 domain-containing protein n=1 Tax=Azorhizobium oxalatiphilum TaxID=980631 RepID=A0A917CKZ9_9HYPH|nr:hypothetical protein [Azorhizobium oxalatiphilum]GGF89672.1 hypothetical protein GCM10007301_56980 [Azorhizobium oxalatiphilum]